MTTLRTFDRYEQMVLDFMHKHGRHYAERINAIECTWDETRAEAGPYGQFCECTMARLARLAADREEELQAAIDRYQDWATD